MARRDPDKVLRLAARRGGVSRRQVAKAGIHTQALSRLVDSGALQRVARGHYRLSESPLTEHHGLAIVAVAAPRAVVCLISALAFHGVGTQLPHDVWVAIDRRDRSPTLYYPKLRVHRFSGKALTEGVEKHHIEGETVRVYGVAKTLADLFKYRNKVGLDVALEALRDAWQRRRFTMDDLHRYARICRVDRVMAPYLAALVA